MKNEVTSNVLDSVKKTTNEWETFMESKQKEVQSAIAASSMDEGRKDAELSKVYVYEVIDIRLSEFSSMISTVSDVAGLKRQVDSYKAKLLSAIDMAAARQIAKYNSLAI